MILNPSFENGNNLWSGIENAKILSSNSNLICYHQNTCYDLSNGIISQNISNILPGTNLFSFLYFQRKNFISENIVVNVTFYDSQNVKIESKILNHVPLTNFNFGFGGFQKLDLESFIVPNSTSNIEFKLIGVGNNILIDAVSLQVASSATVTEKSNQFIAVEIIKPDASYCDLCYNSLDLNSCTKKKSEILGDCSYMVEDVSKNYHSNLSSYSGKEENLFLKMQNESWNSQSLTNSLLFCEMYTRQSECLNPNNYINSKYSSIHIEVKNRSSTLCKWNVIKIRMQIIKEIQLME